MISHSEPFSIQQLYSVYNSLYLSSISKTVSTPPQVVPLDLSVTRINTESVHREKNYIAMIAKVLMDAPEKKLLLHELYQSIWDRFPLLHEKSGSWKLTIRRNLAAHACFIKSDKTGKQESDVCGKHTKTAKWMIHEACIPDFARGDFDKTRIKLMVTRADLDALTTLSRMRKEM